MVTIINDKVYLQFHIQKQVSASVLITSDKAAEAYGRTGPKAAQNIKHLAQAIVVFVKLKICMEPKIGCFLFSMFITFVSGGSFYQKKT